VETPGTENPATLTTHLSGPGDPGVLNLSIPIELNYTNKVEGTRTRLQQVGEHPVGKWRKVISVSVVSPEFG
jgi:hypothetical protein